MDFQGLSTAILESKLITPDTIYIDMTLIKDMRLGAILDLITTEDEYDYIMCNLPTYIARVTDEIDQFFPKLNIPQSTLNDHLINGNPLSIFAKSPITDLLPWLNNYIISINNKCAMIEKRNIPKLIFNTYPIRLPKNIAIKIANMYQTTYAMDVRVISKKFTELDPEIIHQLDEIYIYDFNSFMEDPIYSKEFSTLVFEKVCIFAPRRISNLEIAKVHTTPVALEKDFIITESFIKLMCEFNYLPKIGIACSDM